MNTRVELPNFSRRTFLGVSGGAAMLALAGCAPQANKSKGKAGVTAVSVAFAAAPDPAHVLHRQIDSMCWIDLVFDSLVDLDPKTHEPTPWLAESWKWSEDRNALTLTLRDGVTFHDGRALSPEDVVFSLKAAASPDNLSQIKGILGRTSSIEAEGDNNVVLKFDKPTSNIFDALMFIPIVDSKTFDQYADGKKVNGTGPYKWGTFVQGSTLSLARYKDYWQKNDNAITDVTIRSVTDSKAGLSSLRAKQVQILGGIPGREVKPFAKTPGYTVRPVTSSYQQTYLASNLKVSPLNNIQVRQALQYAVDRKRITDQVYAGYGDVSCLPWPSGLPGVTKDQVTRYDYDPKKAKDLLTKAGALGASVNVIAANSPIFSSVIDVVTFNLNEAGLKAKAVLMDTAAFVKGIQEGSLDGLFVANAGMVSVSPITGLTTATPLRPGNNASNFTEPKYGQLLEAAYAAKSDEELGTLFHEISELFLTESFHITLSHAFDVWTYDDDVQKIETNALGYLKLARASLK